MFTIKHLQYVVAVKKNGSISRASEAMAISVSSIREAIRVVECGLSISLFQRTPSKGAILTKDGECFISNAEKLISAYEDFNNSIYSLGSESIDEITIGVIANAGPLIMAPLIREFLERIPRVRIRLDERCGRDLVDLVRTGRHAVAFTFDDGIHDSLNFTKLFDTSIHVGLPPDHRLAYAPFVHLEELRDDPYILVNFDGAQRYYKGLFDYHGINPNLKFTVSSREMAKNLIQAGLGYSVFNMHPSNSNAVLPEGIFRIPLKSDYWCPSFGVISSNDGSGDVINTLRNICAEFGKLMMRPF